MKAEDLKLIVKEKYSEIANQSKIQNQSSCCGGTCGCNDPEYNVFNVCRLCGRGTTKENLSRNHAAGRIH